MASCDGGTGGGVGQGARQIRGYGLRMMRDVTFVRRGCSGVDTHRWLVADVCWWSVAWEERGPREGAQARAREKRVGI